MLCKNIIFFFCERSSSFHSFLGGLCLTNPPIRLMCVMYACLSTFWFLDSNSNRLLPINLKLNRVVGHHLSYIVSEIGAIWITKWPPPPHLEILFSNSNLKMLLPIDLKLNRVDGHHLGQVVFTIGATPKNKMAAMDVILKFHFQTLSRRLFIQSI